MSEAVIESFLENTLDSVDNALREACTQSSTAWVKDSKLREKISLELNEILNLVPLKVLSKFCGKAIMIVDATSQDMGLITFDHRTYKMKEVSNRIDKFLEQYQEIQYWWMYVLHFVKFTPRGEMDRDSIRAFNNVTEDMKKIEGVLQQKGGNIYSAFMSVSEADMSTDNLRSNLISILDDVHSSVQSLMDSCPRLTLLSYNRLIELYRVWLLGPQTSIDFVSLCMREMFEGVGKLQITLLHSQKIFVCNGFTSYNFLDKISFSETISFTLSLDEFVNQFSMRLKQVIEKSCDVLMVHRINCMKALLVNASVDVVIKNMHGLLQLRVEHLEAMLTNEALVTSTFLLANHVSFAEDIWTCLGHPSGSFVMARSDLLIENVAFTKVWKELLEHFIACSEANIMKLQHQQLIVKTSNRINIRKVKSILSGWIMQEFYFVSIAKHLLECDRVESAIEAWMGHYQLRYQYAKNQRYNNSPLDVVMGNIMLSYGMEYQECGMVNLPNKELGFALGRILSSAFCLHATTVVHSSENISNPLVNTNELTVSGKDIAMSLGRIPLTLTHASQLSIVKAFFSKVVLLDAVGCVDFSTITQSGLQNVIQTAQQCWSVLDSKNDQVIQDFLKYPLKARFSRNELHAERRKNALKSFHNDIYVRQKLHTYVSFILVGFASESEFTSSAVADQYYRSIFDVVTIPYSISYSNLGALLSAAGFLYGFDLQDSFLTALDAIHKKAETDKEMHIDTLLEMCRIDELVRLIEDCRISLSLMSRIDSSDLPKIMVGKSTRLVDRYKEEVVCFCGNLWDRFVTLSCTKKVNYNKVRTELFGPFLGKMEPLTLPETTKLVINSVDSSVLQMRDQVVYSIIKSANGLGYTCKDLFVQYCASLMERLVTTDVPVTMLSGEASVGKSAVLASVIKSINSIKTKIRLDSRSLPVMYRLSAKKIFYCLRAWQEHERRQKILESTVFAPPKPVNVASPGRSSPGGSKPSSRKQTRVRIALNKIREKDDQLVTMLYHGSLSTANLIGSYDTQGRWSDGLLVKKIRLTEAKLLRKNAQDKETVGPIEFDTNNDEYHFIVLNGPISSSIQELFHCMIFQSPRSVYPVFAKSYQLSKTQIVLPTNECLELSDRIKIIVESSDLSTISPSLLPILPNVHIAFTAQESVARIVTVWMRSVYHWLGDFPPWLDFLDELNVLLINSKFIEDLLYDVLNMEHVQIALVNSCLGAFLRMLEELLLQVNEVALEQSHFVVLNEKDVATDSSSDEEPTSHSNLPSRPGSAPPRRRGESFEVAGQSDAGQCTYIGSMSLHPKGREQLLKRARLSVIYAAIWAFGGAYNSTDKRKLFDGVLRDAVQHHMDTDLNVPSDVLVYELVIDIRKACLVPAFAAEKEEVAVLAKAGLSQKYLDQYLYCKLVHGADAIDRLVFHNTASRALSSASNLLAASGSNLLVLGSKGCGKTRLLQDMLYDLQQSTPSPALLRQQIVNNLLDIASGVKTPKGIFRALEIIRTVLLQAASEQASNVNIDPANLKSQTFNSLWRNLTKDLESYLSGSSRINCRNKAVSSSSTSLIGHTKAHSMRGWFEREFATEVPNVLETGRFTYGVAFIDDLHYLANENQKDQHALNDQIGDLLKGILHEFPLFGIERNSSVRSVMTLGNHAGSNDGAFKINTGQPPILHKEHYSDVRLQLDTSDDYMLQRMGLFGAATGHLSDHVNSPWFKRLVSHYAVVSMPSLSVAELHTAFITGAIVSMASARADFNLLEVLQTEIVDLSRITLNTCLRMVSAADVMLTTPLERVLRTMTMLDIGFISRFNLSLRYGCMHVKNPGGLLQLYAHEWKRCMLDPLPDGAQRDRVAVHLIEYLDNLDEKTWGISRNWLKEIKDELKSNVDRVWTNATVLSSRLQMDFDKYNVHTASNGENDNQSADSLSMYLPISMDVESYQAESKKGVWNAITKQYNTFSRKASSTRSLNRDVDMSQLLTDYEISEVMYPAALSLLLRLVRVLSVAGKHVILAGYPGSSKKTAILLAAKICQFVPMMFVAKESQSAIEGCSDKAEAAFDFRLFMKTAVLKSAGFTDPVTLDDLENNPIHQNNPNVMLNSVGLLHPGQVYYEIIAPQRVLAVISEVEQVNSEDRRKLIHIIDYDDPTVLFTDAELIGR
ncbi:hypothetical protein EON65_02065 [archaeon]|nr:MAG: hypothetical protein EON65_02065 [archaeon]